MNYTYARCACGWQDEVVEGGSPAAALLRWHIDDCQYPNRSLLIPMWSVSWPYYHSEVSEAWRAGGPTPDFGLEMTWLPPGAHSTDDPFSPYKHGGMAKQWYLFP